MAYGTRRVRLAGFTLLELFVVIGVISSLTAVAVPSYLGYVRKAERVITISDITDLQNSITVYEYERGMLPLSLDDIVGGNKNDPWGNPYQYLNFSTVKGKGKFRKDRFLVPINSTYDLYSMGPDGASQSPLTAKASRDDIIRASDGAFIGPAEEY